MLNIFLTNLGKYNEGYCVLDCGKWVKLPLSEEELKKELKNIGVEDDTIYEEYCVTDFETDLPSIKVEMYTNIFKLSEEYQEFDELSEYEQHLVCAMLEAGYTSSLSEALQQYSCYSLYEDIMSEYEAGEFLLSDTPIPSEVKDYIRYRDYFNDISTGRSMMLTSYGLLTD